MSEPVSLAEARAVKADDARLWTPLDALRAMVRDVEDGTLNPRELSICFFEPNGEGSKLGTICAGVTREGHVYLLSHALKRAMDD